MAIWMSVYDRIVDVGLLAFFFFFKQKTAYEMRISDWSSDVCSSDLIHRADARPCRPARGSLFGAEGPQRACHHAGRNGGFTGEIGRASCRERVCQYV